MGAGGDFFKFWLVAKQMIISIIIYYAQIIYKRWEKKDSLVRTIYIYVCVCVCVCVREREKIVSHTVDDLLLMAELVDEFC